MNQAEAREATKEKFRHEALDMSVRSGGCSCHVHWWYPIPAFTLGALIGLRVRALCVAAAARRREAEVQRLWIARRWGGSSSERP